MAPRSDVEQMGDAAIRRELLSRAIALGDELVRLADDLGQSIAGTHICQGIEMMRAAVEAGD